MIAFEIDQTFAKRATANLADYPNITVHGRSGSEGPLPAADVIYVSAGATAPLKIWLDALQPHGRLIFPLTPAEGVGGMLLVSRKDANALSASFISPAVFIPCIGARDQQTAERLTQGRHCQR